MQEWHRLGYGSEVFMLQQEVITRGLLELEAARDWGRQSYSGCDRVYFEAWLLLFGDFGLGCYVWKRMKVVWKECHLSPGFIFKSAIRTVVFPRHIQYNAVTQRACLSKARKLPPSIVPLWAPANLLACFPLIKHWRSNPIKLPTNVTSFYEPSAPCSHWSNPTCNQWKYGTLCS